jgi:hypothetical protein
LCPQNWWLLSCLWLTNDRLQFIMKKRKRTRLVQEGQIAAAAQLARVFRLTPVAA